MVTSVPWQLSSSDRRKNKDRIYNAPGDLRRGMVGAPEPLGADTRSTPPGARGSGSDTP